MRAFIDLFDILFLFNKKSISNKSINTRMKFYQTRKKPQFKFPVPESTKLADSGTARPF